MTKAQKPPQSACAYLYPEEIHGLRLGLRVARIRKGQLYTADEHRRELAKIGLVFDYPNDSSGIIHPKMSSSSHDKSLAYSSSAGVSIVSTTPAASKVTSSSATTGAVNKGEGIVNTWSSREHTRMEKFNLIVKALKVHDDLFGDLLVPRYFIVPDEEPWPKETWGLQLGNRVRNIRAKRAYNTPYFHEILTKMGFLFDITAYKMQFGKAQGDDLFFP
jgi:hypothetical protein